MKFQMVPFPLISNNVFIFSRVNSYDTNNLYRKHFKRIKPKCGLVLCTREIMKISENGNNIQEFT